MKKILLAVSLFIIATGNAYADERIAGVTWPKSIYTQLKITAAIKGYDARELASEISYKGKGRFPKCDLIEDKLASDEDDNIACYKFKCSGLMSGFAPDVMVVHNYANSSLRLMKSCSWTGESW